MKLGHPSPWQYKNPSLAARNSFTKNTSGSSTQALTPSHAPPTPQKLSSPAWPGADSLRALGLAQPQNSSVGGGPSAPARQGLQAKCTHPHRHPPSSTGVQGAVPTFLTFPEPSGKAQGESRIRLWRATSQETSEGRNEKGTRGLQMATQTVAGLTDAYASKSSPLQVFIKFYYNTGLLFTA